MQEEFNVLQNLNQHEFCEGYFCLEKEDVIGINQFWI